MKKIFLILVIITVVFANTDRSIKKYIQTHQNEKKVALVIGNSNYYKFPKLPNALNDAKDVKDALEKMGFTVVYGQNLTKKETLKMLRKFNEELNYKSIALFYYAGHGLEVKNINYILPLKADIASKIDVPYEAISLNRIVDEMKIARLKIVVIDACRNNPFGRGIEKTTFAPLNANGTILAFGTSSGEEASENSKGKNGLFTKYFLKTLNKPNLNQRDFFAEIRKEVYLNSNQLQKPTVYDATIEDFYFNIDTSKLKHKEVISNAQKPDEILWNKIKNSKNIEDYKFFIKLYPNSAYVSLAKFSIVKLSSKTTKSKITTKNDKIWRDPDTGLMWQNEKYTDKEKKAILLYNYGKTRNLEGARKYCSSLNLEGYNDWRLPSITELKTIFNENYYNAKYMKLGIKKPLLKSMHNLKIPLFWSYNGFVFNFNNHLNVYPNKEFNAYVRCVRGDKLKESKYSLSINRTPSNARIYITNIKSKYYDGIMLKPAKYHIKVVADGYETKKFDVILNKDTLLNVKLKKIKRISNNIIWKDPKTKLIWQNESYTNKEQKAYLNYNYMKVGDWYYAKKYCSKLDLAGYKDWRLPNIEELKTIKTSTAYFTKFSKIYLKKELLSSVYLLKGKYGYEFWSATSLLKDNNEARGVNFKGNYKHDYYYKDGQHYIRCVRGKLN